MHILYLHPAGTFGGASKSLVELFQQLRQLGVTGTVLTPSGTANEAFAKAGLTVRTVRGLSQFDNTRYGHYRHLRWIILAREVFLLPFSLLGLWRLRHIRPDIIHVNEITLLPLALVAKAMFGVPMVVHVRSLQRGANAGRRSDMVNGWLRCHADAVVAIDHTVAATLPEDVRPSIIHNGLEVDGIVQQNHPYKRMRVGFLGVLLALKGVYELVDSFRILKDRGVQIECWIAGENAREVSGLHGWALGKLGFARDVRADLEAMIQRHGLQDHVRLLGLVHDIRQLLPQLDVVCFPSHLDAAGRPVFEAALYGIPSVVALKDPKPDALVHGVTGLAIDYPDAELLADALQRLANDPDYRLRLGRQARKWAAENFSIEQSGKDMYASYRSLLAQNTDGKRD